MTAAPELPAPMAFDFADFFLGGGTSVATFTCAVCLPFVLAPMYLPMIAVVALIFSLGAYLVFGYPAFLIGRTLVSVRLVRVHLALFAAYGLVVGATVAALSFLVMFGMTPDAWWVLVGAVLCAGAMMIGWWTAARPTVRALRTASRRV